MSKVEVDLSALLTLQRRARVALDEGTEAAAKDIEDLASQLAPKDSTALSQSGKVEKINDAVYEISFGNPLEGGPLQGPNGEIDDPSDGRAVIQEFGGVNQAAQPYLTPAAQEINIAYRVKEKLGTG